MGYAVSVTPLQMAVAVGAVANGGELVEPRLVRAVIRNGMRAETPTRTIRRAIGTETASELTRIMERVAEEGTARSAQVPGYRVAGKTGTAEKLVNGQYSNTDHNASFIGFVPSRRPALTVMVMIDTPAVVRRPAAALRRLYFGVLRKMHSATLRFHPRSIPRLRCCSRQL